MLKSRSFPFNPFWLPGALGNYILGTLDLLKNDFAFGRFWHSPFIFSFSCLSYQNEIYDIGTEILSLTKNDHNSTNQKKVRHSPSSDSVKTRFIAIFKK